MLYLVDSAGARITDQIEMFPGRRGAGRIFYLQCQMSGLVPQVCLLFGPSAAGGAYIPAFCDIVVMVDGNASMYLGSPRMAEMVIGEKVTLEELGGARMHCTISGCGDVLVKTEEEAIAAAQRYLGFFPENFSHPPPVRAPVPPAASGKRIEEIIPPDQNKFFDMFALLRELVDKDSLFELKKLFAPEVITALARIDGRPVGIVASQPKRLGGILDNDSADKAAHFVTLCDAFGIPLVFLVDVPGFMVGTKVEAAGIIRHGAKMLHAVAAATVPKITVVLRKAYGAGYYVMNGRAYEPDLIVAWPTAEISVMGAEGAVEIVFRKEVEAAADPAAKKAELIAAYRELIDVYVAARNDMIDDVIDPRETRPTIIRALEMAEGKRVQRPWKRHGVVPV
jgi:acetyl-CoA carboxylase carboxyltransferase component